MRWAVTAAASASAARVGQGWGTRSAAADRRRRRGGRKTAYATGSSLHLHRLPLPRASGDLAVKSPERARTIDRSSAGLAMVSR